MLLILLLPTSESDALVITRPGSGELIQRPEAGELSPRPDEGLVERPGGPLPDTG